jgi:hypothetical protein
MFEHVDDNRMKYICNKIIDNKAIFLSNSRIWTAFLDDQVRDFVVQYNFNFFEVANRFHDFIAFPYKYDFSEDEIRRHWSFLHACRYLGIEIDDEYYDKLKTRAKEVEKEVNSSKEKVEDEIDLEKEKREIEKFKAERFNLIDMGQGKSKEKGSETDVKIYDDNPVEQNLKNDDHFEKCIENIDLKRNENGQEVEVYTTISNNEKTNIKNETAKNSKPEIKNIKNNINGKDDFVEKSINEINKATENKDSSNCIEKLSVFDDDDVINALFKVALKISNEELSKDLTIDGKYYKLPEAKTEKEEDLFPINTNNIPQHNLTEEEMLNYREKILYDFNNEGLDRNIDKTKSFDDLIKEDESLKAQYDNLNTYFNFAVKSLNYFVPKMSKKLKGNDNKGNFDKTVKEKKKGIISILILNVLIIVILPYYIMNRYK